MYLLQYLLLISKGKNVYHVSLDLCGKNNGIIMGHIISRDNGGTYNLENLLWTCQLVKIKLVQIIFI